MAKPTVLISGGGIAGPTLAFWLARHGFAATVVERAAGERGSGSPVDVRGEAVRVAERMGILPRLRAASTGVTRTVFVDRRGRPVGALAIEPDGQGIEVPRADLARILRQAAGERTEFVFGDRIASLTPDGAGVDATFVHGAPRRFDLVVGADGVHSAVRRLCFGPDARFIRHRGLYVATVQTPGEDTGAADTVLIYNEPGRAAAIHPNRGRPGAAFLFRRPPLPGFQPDDAPQHRRLVAAAYAGAAWRVPRLLERLRVADDIFCAAICQVRVRRWSQGRIALLGDAASCVSLFGEGSSMAMIGGAALAESLAARPEDPATAFAAYEGRVRPLAERRQRGASVAAAILVPATDLGIRARNLGARLFGRAGRTASGPGSGPADARGGRGGA